MRGGAGTALVGDPETVAARMQEYADLGIETFILSGYPHLEESYRFAELVFPLLPRQGQGRSGEQSLTGPFGEIIANDIAAEEGGADDAASLTRRSTARAAPLRALAAARWRCCPDAWAARGARGWLSSAHPARAAGAWRRRSGTLAASGELWHARARQPVARRCRLRPSAAGSAWCSACSTAPCRRAETLLDTTLQMVRNIPALALIPLVILWFGIDESAKLFLVALGVFFPIYLNTFHGIRSVDAGLIEMARSYGLSGWPLYREVILPGALPSILVGLRFSLGLMWVLLIVAETISAQSGIGYMTMNAREFLQTDVVLVGVLLYALLGKLADLVARGLERRFLRWNPAYQTAEAADVIGSVARTRCGDPCDATGSRRPHARPRRRDLKLRGLSKRYGGRTVLDDVDLDVAPGEFVAIVGRSGCGKSTLLRADRRAGRARRRRRAARRPAGRGIAETCA